MKSKKINRGKEGFTTIVELKAGETCQLKRHYRNCHREVVGYLDKLAANDPEGERFVWASVPGIVKHCNKYRKKKEPYHQRQVEYALATLREQLVLSERVERFRHGCIRPGWIFAPHDAVTVVENNCCDFKGQTHWEREIKQEKDANGNWIVTAIGPVIFAESAASVRRAVRPSVRSENAKCAAQCAVGNEKIALETEQDKTTYAASAPPNRVSLLHSSGLAVPTDITENKNGGQAETETAKDKSNSNPSRAINQRGAVWGDSVVQKPMNEETETIGQHFDISAKLPELHNIADGVLNPDTKQWQEFSGAIDLLLCCYDVIDELAEQPYLGRKTNALVMDAGMKRYNAKHKTLVPSSWLKVLNDFKRANTRRAN